jgi:hypothetical protein
MDSKLTNEDLAHFTEGLTRRLNKAEAEVLKVALEEVKGRTFTTVRRLKDSITGDRHDMEVEMTVTGVRLGYDSDIILICNYTHPFTRKTIEAEHSP